MKNAAQKITKPSEDREIEASSVVVDALTDFAYKVYYSNSEIAEATRF